MRRLSIRSAVAVCLILWAAAALAQPSVTSVGLNVRDLDRSVAFFTEQLEFQKTGGGEVYGEPHERFHGVFGMRARYAELRLGDETIVLTEFLTPRGRPIPADSRSNDLWFQHVAIVVSDIDAAYARLAAHRVRHVSTAPQTLPASNPNAGGIRAFYFQDDDGHNLELIWYPPGKGDPRWQRRDGRLFLGIDHTAIAVSDTERSLAFWRDVAGLRVVGGSENYGTEQEHLNLVFGARLRITALRGASGPGVEFLEYLTPSTGREAPRDAAGNDIAHWTTTLAVDDLDRIAAAAQRMGSRLVSAGIVESGTGRAGGGRAVQLRDPDGHAVAFVER